MIIYNNNNISKIKVLNGSFENSFVFDTAMKKLNLNFFEISKFHILNSFSVI